jgi:hypothetical protein
MKKVCVPRFAVIAKYESSAGDRILACIQAKYGVSHRIRGKRACRILYRHGGSLRLSEEVCQYKIVVDN